MPVFSHMSCSFDFELWRVLISSICVVPIPGSALQFLPLKPTTFKILISSWATDAGQASETWRIFNTCSHSKNSRMTKASVWHVVSPAMTTCLWKSDISLISSPDVDEKVQCPLNWKWRILLMVADLSFRCTQISPFWSTCQLIVSFVLQRQDEHGSVQMYNINRRIQINAVFSAHVALSVAMSLSPNQLISRDEHAKQGWVDRDQWS